MSRHRSWCFTLNNYTAEDMERFELWTKVGRIGAILTIKYMVVGQEVGGDTGTPHLQGYVCWTNPQAFKRLQGICERIHWEVARGGAEDNFNYCSKEKLWLEYGDRPAQGARSDLLGIVGAVKDGYRMRQLVEEGVIGNYQALRMAENLMKLYETRRNWKTEVIWVCGKSGCGKTRYCEEQTTADTNEDNVYWKESATGKWWCGYDGEEFIIIDDFRDSHFELSALLRILDRYPCKVEVKGGMRQLVPKKIYISSIFHPEDCYKHAKGEPIEQLLRRIDSIIEM